MKMNERSNETSKIRIADIAKSLIRDDMVIFLDSSSTSLHLIDVLSKFDGLQIITNGVMTASMLSEFTNARVSILGGSILTKRYTVNGAKAYNDALTYNADIAFVSCRGSTMTKVQRKHMKVKHSSNKLSGASQVRSFYLSPKKK